MQPVTCSLLTQATSGFGRCPSAGSSLPSLGPASWGCSVVTVVLPLAVIFGFREGSASTHRAISFFQRVVGSGDLYRLLSWELAVNMQSIRLGRRSAPRSEERRARRDATVRR